jgi:nucleoid DNA-binding protein
MKPSPITRLNFVHDMMEVGLSYDQSLKAYNAVMSTIANGVVNGQRVYLGNIGCLNPSVQPPRQVIMGFDRKGGKVTRKQREFSLDSRLRYKFRLFKKFVETHELNWFG